MNCSTDDILEFVNGDSVESGDQKNFDNRRKKIKKNLEKQEDRDFIDTYCFNNGDNFRTCLKEITKESLIILSGLNDVERYNEQISVIINDRNAYTHASKKIVQNDNSRQAKKWKSKILCLVIN